MGYFREGNVVGMCIQIPSHRGNGDEISVEHLYTDSALSTCLSATEKRLRFEHEIGFRSDRRTPFLLPEVGGPSLRIVDKDVGQVARVDGSDVGEVAISKSVFLTEIAKGQLGEHFDLSGFCPTFDKIREIISQVEKEVGDLGEAS